MKLVTVRYMGFTAMDRRFSDAMLPWIVSEIRKRESREQVSLGAEDGTLQGYNTDFELQFSHRIQDISRFSQADTDPCAFLYLVTDQNDRLLYCYMFQANQSTDVSDLYQQIREQSASTSGPSLTSLCGDISPSSSHFFEVLYVGKIRVSHRKVPETFIDDALEKFKSHEIARRASYDSTTSNDSSPNESVILHQNVDENTQHIIEHPILSSQLSIQSLCSEKGEKFDNETSNQKSDLTIQSNETSDVPIQGQSIEKSVLSSHLIEKTSLSTHGHGEISVAKKESHDHNRTMVLQVGRSDLRLISPDRKQVLLHRHHKDVVACVQGSRSPEHFGFVCREPHNSQQQTQQQQSHLFVGYIFKCESPSVVSDAVGAVSQAAVAPSVNTGRSGSITSISGAPQSLWSPSSGVAVTTCEHCPMVWYHRLCVDVEGLGDRKTQATIFRRVENLDEEEQQSILTKFRGAETVSIRDQNEFLMMLLRAHCEMKQNRHVHDTAENRSEFLSHYLGNTTSDRGTGTIFMKAKRSLSSSFEHLLKRKGSRDDIGALIPRDLSLPVVAPQLSVREGSPTTPTSTTSTVPSSSEILPTSAGSDSNGKRTRSVTIGSVDYSPSGLSPEKSGQIAASPKSPMMDIFMKVGNSPRTPVSDPDSPQNGGTTPRNHGSWRQAIFNRVVTPNKNGVNQKMNRIHIGLETNDEMQETREKRTSEELRSLWKRAIKQAVLLVRMEKENARLRLRQEASAMKRVKLEYDEMTLHTSSALPLWDMVSGGGKPDRRLLLGAAARGVPAARRGEVWQRLAKMYCNDKAPFNITSFPNYDVPYEQLLKQLTAHQHAILIDLGRTFPNHPFFKSPLGPGQLALFNLLKAYSLLDPEVGYCQGLSFVAGVLLLHMEEADAFKLLKHLMFRRGLRALYLPDMIALQIRLYQLSRLLHDRQPELYNHLDAHEVAPTLYAAPWLLTLFASQFPLGFVARVLDVLFVEGPDIIFRIALSLLAHHSEALINCDHFEQIMEYLKCRLPELDATILDKVLAATLTPASDVSQRLNEYKVEYQVLQEEASSTRPYIEEVDKLRHENRALLERNRTLSAQLEISVSNVQRLERNRTLQQSAINKLEVQTRTLEVSVVTLGTFIDSLVERRVDIQIPGDARRIVSQLMVNERRKNDQRPESSRQLIRTISNSTNLFKKDDENTLEESVKETNPRQLPRAMVKSLSTGRIGVSLFNNSALNATQNAANEASAPRSISLNSASDLEKELRLERPLSLLPEHHKGAHLRVLEDDAKDSQFGQNLGSKVSHFFSNTHSHILRQHRPPSGASSPPPMTPPHHYAHMIREESREDMSPSDEQPSFEPNNNTTNRNNINLPLNETTSSSTVTDIISPSDSTDSGVGVTPISPSDGTLTIDKLSTVDNDNKTQPHPLSGCDVTFTYNGTTKLKTIKSIKNMSRNSSPDLLGK